VGRNSGTWFTDITVVIVIITNFDEGQGYGLEHVPVPRVGQNGFQAYWFWDWPILRHSVMDMMEERIFCPDARMLDRLICDRDAGQIGKRQVIGAIRSLTDYSDEFPHCFLATRCRGRGWCDARASVGQGLLRK
jgi:hypothetical protein